jgi:hypothetical protein
MLVANGKQVSPREQRTALTLSPRAGPYRRARRARRFRRLQDHPQGGLGRALRQAYYFSCEADDRMNVCAFSRANPFGAQLNAIYSSDIGHIDVSDMRDPLPEAWELVEDGLITEANFRDFTFTNAVRLWCTQNPHFFEGTVVAEEAAAVLAEPKILAAAE